MSDADNPKKSDENSAGRSNETFTPHDICRVAVRPPPFWPEEPAVWFAQLEGNFALAGIKDDDTKYYYVQSNLEHRYAAEVKDIIISPPAKGKYEKIKSELIKRLSVTREKEVKQLMLTEEIGDRRPGQFLRHLQHLAGPKVPEEFILAMWTSRLPSNIQTVIASQPNLSLQDLADLADRVFDIVPATPQVAAAQAPTTALEAMSKQIEALTQQVEALSTRGRSSRSKYSGNHGNNSRRSESNYRRYPTCWFHFKFGKKATKCIKPCNFKQENSQDSQ
ncbi:uncharacterized protein [Choristoneura fumiferana]|uniref:uncharacterized protein n=1 Tax=Choristoneura fumiferana TaxID=7141 RepID=UPI003D155216